MSTSFVPDSFACRSSNSRNPYSPPSGERRRQWLRQRGLLSTHNGPTRRLANLLPRKHPSSESSSRKTPSQQQSSAHIQLEVDHNSVPVVVAKPLKLDSEDAPPLATRTVSMPIDGSSRHRTAAFRSRSNHRRWMRKDVDRNASPPSRSRRLLNRLTRKSREWQQSDVRVRQRASIDVPRARDRDVDRVSLHRHSLDRRRVPFGTNTNSRPRARAVYTVFDKQLPRHVLEGDSHYEKSAWNDYREHIDELAEDAKFMDYLTAPVSRRPPLKPESGPNNGETQNLAVNRLYPLAFIRLLEAHAKYSAESGAPCDPEDEEHRYDDVDRDDEAKVERTVSNGLYDMGRFRTVGGTQQRWSSDSKTVEMQHDCNMPKLLGGKKYSDASPYQSRLFSRISRDSETTSVPVC